MAHITADFCKESSTSTGTGDFVLGGVRSPARTFGSVCSNGDTVHYAISHDTLNQWEVGLGTYNSGPNSITRTQVLSSSNANALVNFSAGTKRVDLVEPAARIVQQVGPVQVGATSFGSGSLSFSNANGVSWGLATNSAGGTITASVAAGAASISVSAGTSSAALASLVFNNTNGVSWGLNGSTLTAIAPMSFSGGNFVANAITGATEATMSATRIIFQSFAPGATTAFSRMNVSVAMLNTLGQFQDLFFVGEQRVVAGAAAVTGVPVLSFKNTNGISWTMNTSTLTNEGVAAVIEASAPGLGALGVVSHVGGNSVTNATALAFSDASNISWNLSTAAGGATVRASGAPVFSASLVPIAANVFSITDATASTVASSLRLNVLATSQNTDFSWANISWRVDTASVALGLAAMNVIGGTGQAQVQHISFSNVANHTFGLSTTTVANFGKIALITASIYALKFINLSNLSNEILSVSDATGTSLGNVSLRFPQLATELSTAFSVANVAWRFSGNATGFALAHQSYIDGGSTVPAQAVSFSNANGVSFSVQTSNVAGIGRIAQVVASVGAGGAAGSISAGTTNVALGQAVLSNSNNVSFGLNGSTITASASDLRFGLISHSGGNSVGSATALVFSNANNVTWSLSTNAGGGTVLASVATFLGIGAISAAGNSVSSGSVVFSNSNNVSFGMAGSTITASASLPALAISAAGASASAGTVVFSNSNGVTFGQAGSTVTASVNAGGGVTYDGFNPFRGEIVFQSLASDVSAGSVWVAPIVAAPNFAFDRVILPIVISVSTAATGSFTLRQFIGLYTKNGNTLSLAHGSSGSHPVTVSGTTGAYLSSFAGPRMASFGWTTTIPAGNYWIGLGSSISVAGALNSGSLTVSRAMYSQNVGATTATSAGTSSAYPFAMLGAATASSVQLDLGAGFWSAANVTTNTAAIPISQIIGTNSLAYRRPVVIFEQGTV